MYYQNVTIMPLKITQGIYFVKYRVIFEIITIDTFLVY